MMACTSRTRGIVYSNKPGLPFTANLAALPGHSAFNTASKSVLLEGLRKSYKWQMHEGSLPLPADKMLESAYEAGLNLQNLVAGKIFVDLGSGRERLPSSVAFAKSLGAASYIGVDVCFPDDPIQMLSPLGATASVMGILLVEANMLDFLQLVPPSSPVVAMMNLITGDRELYFPSGFAYDFFCNAVAKELTRIVQPGGLAFGMSSAAFAELPAKSWRSSKEGGTFFALRVQ